MTDISSRPPPNVAIPTLPSNSYTSPQATSTSEASLATLRSLLHSILRITSSDGRVFVGTFAGTDKALNIILVGADEFREESTQPGLYSSRFVGQIMVPWKIVKKVEAQKGNGRNERGELPGVGEGYGYDMGAPGFGGQGGFGGYGGEIM